MNSIFHVPANTWYLEESPDLVAEIYLAWQAVRKAGYNHKLIVKAERAWFRKVKKMALSGENPCKELLKDMAHLQGDKRQQAAAMTLKDNAHVYQHWKNNPDRYGIQHKAWIWTYVDEAIKESFSYEIPGLDIYRQEMLSFQNKLREKSWHVAVDGYDWMKNNDYKNDV